MDIAEFTPRRLHKNGRVKTATICIGETLYYVQDQDGEYHLFEIFDNGNLSRTLSKKKTTFQIIKDCIAHNKKYRQGKSV